jgi:hypothetical protein
MWREFERLKRDGITNRTDEGEYLERILIDFLSCYLPRKLSVGRGYVMNEDGNTSLQQDVIIYNADNYVLLRNTDGFQVYPVESVYAVIEVKSTLSKQVLKDANENAASIKYLSGVKIYIEPGTGKIVELEQFGAVVFCGLFAFQADSSLQTCLENFDELSSSIDFGCILDRGLMCYLDHEKMVDEKKPIVRTKSTPNREKDMVCSIAPQNPGASAIVLALLLEHIISHAEENKATAGKYSMLNYLKIPPSAYSMVYKKWIGNE